MKYFYTILKKTDSGFTLMESVITLFLFSLFQLWFWQGTTHSQLTLLKITELQKQQNTLFQAKFYSEYLLSSIEIPFFLSDVPITIHDTLLSIPYFEGNKEAVLAFFLNPEVEELIISTPYQNVSIKHITKMETMPIVSNNLYGIHLRFFNSYDDVIDVYYSFLGLAYD